MLSISQAQLDLLKERCVSDFLPRARDHLSERCPRQIIDVPHSELDEFIREVIPRAEKYGISSGTDILRYLELACRHGRNFDQTENWAQDRLNRLGHSGWRKLNALEAYEIHVIMNEVVQ